MMWFGWGSGGWVSWLAMGISMLIFWGGVVALIIWPIRSGGRSSDPKLAPLSVLEERFARGEIDAEEFESRRDVLAKR